MNGGSGRERLETDGLIQECIVASLRFTVELSGIDDREMIFLFEKFSNEKLDSSLEEEFLFFFVSFWAPEVSDLSDEVVEEQVYTLLGVETNKIYWNFEVSKLNFFLMKVRTTFLWLINFLSDLNIICRPSHLASGNLREILFF